MAELFLDVGLLVAGLVLLYFGAEWLVGGAAGLASSFGIRKLIIGLTVVAYGTSAPELVVGISAGLRDQGGIALGNVIGSNIANLGLVLSVCALIRVPRVDPQIVKREIPVLIIATGLVPLVLVDDHVSRFEALGLLALAAAYTAWMILSSKRGSSADASLVADDAAEASAHAQPKSRRSLVGLTLAGLAGLVGGGHLLVTGAIGVASAAGMSDRIIGLTIVAVGTSLPELATSVIAALRGHSEIAVGNVVGSNIFNVVLILGASGLTGTIETPFQSLALELIAMGGMTAVAALAMTTRRLVGRFEAVVLLLGHMAFLIALALR